MCIRDSPVSVLVDTFGTARIEETKIQELVKDVYKRQVQHDVDVDTVES